MNEFNLIDFSKASLPDLEELFSNQDAPTMQMVVGWLSRDGIHCRDVNSALKIPTDQVGLNIGKVRQVGVRLEIWNRHGLTLEEFMTEKFGRDWETQLHRPRGSQSVGKRVDVGIKRENKIAASFNKAAKETDSEERMQILVASHSMQMGQPMLSLRPIAVGKDPCWTEIEPGTFAHVHSPGENSVECKAMKTEVFIAPIVSVVGNRLTGGDMTGGCGSKQVAIIGFAEHWKSSVCGKIGLVGLPGEEGPVYRSIVDDNSKIAEVLLASQIARERPEELKRIFVSVITNSALFQYYASHYPSKNPFQLVAKAYSGGTLKMKYFGSEWITKELADSLGMKYTGSEKFNGVDVQIDIKNRLGVELVHNPHPDFKQTMERKIQWNEEEIMNRIRLTAGLIEKMPSPAEMIADRATRAARTEWEKNSADILKQHVEEWKKHPDSGEDRPTVESLIADGFIIECPDGEMLPDVSEELIGMLRAEVIDQMRKRHNATVKRGNKEVAGKNMGKMMKGKSMKFRNGDKSTTVNGMRSVQLENGFGLVRINGVYKEPMNRQRLEEVLSEIGFDWESYARKRIESGEFKPAWTAKDRAGDLNTGLSRKDNREQLAEIMIRRMLQASLEEVLALKSGWVGLADYGQSAFVEMRHVFGDTEEFGKLQDAAKLVMDAGEEPTMKNIMSAYKRPGPWQMLAGKANASPMTQAFRAAKKG